MTATPASTASSVASATLTLADVFRARRRQRPHLKPPPLIEAPALAEHLGLDVRLKLEILLPTSSFKVRGGINLVGAIDEGLEPKPRGFCTASTGNHGQSIAYAARIFGYPCVVYAPLDCNPVKAEAMRRLGAELVLEGHDYDASREAAEAEARRRGYRFIEPIEPLLVAGVATSTLEILDDWPSVDTIIVPLGGGSGAAAACLAGKSIKPSLEVIAVQATGAPAFYNAWTSGALGATERADTFAEGLATRLAYDLALQLLRGTLDDVVLVSDQEIQQAMVALLRHAHLLAEAAGAASTAAASQPALRARLAGKQVALVVSGANVTPESLRQVLQNQLA